MWMIFRDIWLAPLSPCENVGSISTVTVKSSGIRPFYSHIHIGPQTADSDPTPSDSPLSLWNNQTNNTDSSRRSVNATLRRTRSRLAPRLCARAWVNLDVVLIPNRIDSFEWILSVWTEQITYLGEHSPIPNPQNIGKKTGIRGVVCHFRCPFGCI